MTASPLPAGPIVLAVAASVLFAGTAYVWLNPAPKQNSLELPIIQATEAPLPAVPVQYHSTEDAQRATSGIMQSSPFEPGRSAYSRTPPRTAPKPVYNPQLVGISGKGDALRALIIWKPGEAAQPTAIGDDTPWGPLISATSNELVFKGTDGVKKLSLF